MQHAGDQGLVRNSFLISASLKIHQVGCRKSNVHALVLHKGRARAASRNAASWALVGRADTSLPFSYAPRISRSNRSSFFIALSGSKIISRGFPAWDNGLQKVIGFSLRPKGQEKYSRDRLQRAQPDLGIAAGSGVLLSSPLYPVTTSNAGGHPHEPQSPLRLYVRVKQRRRVIPHSMIYCPLTHTACRLCAQTSTCLLQARL